MLVFMMKAAAARRKQEQLPTQWWGEEDPQVRKGGGAKTHKGMQCCSPWYRWDHKIRCTEVHSRQQKTYHSNRIWPEIFLNCSADGQGSNDAGHHRTANR